MICIERVMGDENGATVENHSHARVMQLLEKYHFNGCMSVNMHMLKVSTSHALSHPQHLVGTAVFNIQMYSISY